jgi:hypothetical protein
MYSIRIYLKWQTKQVCINPLKFNISSDCHSTNRKQNYISSLRFFIMFCPAPSQGFTCSLIQLHTLTMVERKTYVIFRGWGRGRGGRLEISWQCNTTYMPYQSTNCLWRTATALWKCRPSDRNTMFTSQSVLLQAEATSVCKNQRAQMEGTPVGTLHILHDSQRSSATHLTSNVHKHRHFHFWVFQNVNEISVFWQ